VVVVPAGLLLLVVVVVMVVPLALICRRLATIRLADQIVATARVPRLPLSHGIVFVKFPGPGESWEMSLVLEI